MVGFFTTWASSPQMAEALFQSVSSAAARYPDRYSRCPAIAQPRDAAPLRGAGSGSSRTVARRRRDRRGVRCAERLAARRCRCAGARNLSPLPRGTIAEHDGKRHLGAAGIPVLYERLVTKCRGSSRRGNRDRRAVVLKDRLARHSAQDRDGRPSSNVPASEAGAALSTDSSSGFKARAPQAKIDASSGRRWSGRVEVISAYRMIRSLVRCHARARRHLC